MSDPTTRAEARRRACEPPLVISERRTPDEHSRYVASIEAAIDALRDWASAYAHLIEPDDEALAKLEQIVSSSNERTLAVHEKEVRRRVLVQVSDAIRAASETGQMSELERMLRP